MNEQDAGALDEVLSRFERRAQERDAAMDKSRSAELQFNADAERVFKEVIRPAMDEVAAKVRERRHDCDIKEEEETLTNDLKTRPKSITMTVRAAAPLGAAVTGRTAHGISFSVVRHEKKVVVTSVGSSGPGPQPTPKGRASYELPNLTRDTATKQLITFLGEVLK